MHSLPKAIETAIENLADLPGIGSRSAERLVFSLLRNSSGLDQRLAESIGKLRERVRECKRCFHFCDGDFCKICSNSTRDFSTICVVENPMALIALERTHEFRGVYHVLHGVISPMQKIRPEDLKIPAFFSRFDESICEVILALSGNIEAEATENFLAENLRRRGFSGKISKLARGIPSGGSLDFLDSGTIGRAVLDRREI